MKPIDTVSKTMCLAKWTATTLYLQNGHTHSCHHPRTHQASVEEVQVEPSALHNTGYKKSVRDQMLDGTRPVECEFCWRAEDAGQISDRYLKSEADWSAPFMEEVLTAGANTNMDPRYLEVSFSNVCNLKCSYCAPHISSKWMEEIRQYGAYPTSTEFNSLEWLRKQSALPIPERDPNPYVEAFWKWFPQLYPKLLDFRITGGEPLMSKHTIRALEWILNHPNPGLRLSVNTNLCVPDDLLNRFLDLVSEIVRTGAVRSFDLFTSSDTSGVQAEYIRNGFDYSKWFKNLKHFFVVFPRGKANIMCTFNALSPFGFERFYEDITYFRRAGHRLGLDLPHLSYPAHQAIWVLPESMVDRFEAIEDQIHGSRTSLHNERLKISRIVEMFKRSPWSPEEQARHRKDFGIFFREHDRRRGTDFCSVFPELRELYAETNLNPS